MMSKNGYIKDYRKELESDIWLMPPLYGRVWQWIKYSVNHKDKAIPQPDGTDFMVKSGQRLTSLRQMAHAVAWQEGVRTITPSAETIARIVKWLESKNMITVFRGCRDRSYTLITVVNWAFYQGGDDDGVTLTGTATEHTQEHPQVLNNNEEECKRNSSSPKFSEEDFSTAEWIYSKLLEMNPTHKEPNLTQWANTIRLMREQDKRADAEIRDLFTWANQDDFWSTNILSPATLRKQWDKLVIKRGKSMVGHGMNNAYSGDKIIV